MLGLALAHRHRDEPRGRRDSRRAALRASIRCRRCRRAVSGPVGRRKPAPRALAAAVLGAGVDRVSDRSASPRRSSTPATPWRSPLALLLGPLLVAGDREGAPAPPEVVRPVEGALAADSLIQAPRRTSASVAALMLSLALDRRVRRHGARQLRLDRRLDGHDAQSRSVRDALSAARRPDDQVPGDDGAGDRRRCPASSACRCSATIASPSAGSR